MIERCTDFRRIRKFCDWDLSIDPGCIYLAEVHDGVDLGVWFFHPLDDGLSMHAEFAIGGRVAKRSAIEALDWIFANTSLNVVYAVIPPGRHDVRRLANSVGFTFYRKHEDGGRIYIIKRPERMAA